MDLSPYFVLLKFAAKYGGIQAIHLFIEMLNDETPYELIAMKFGMSIGRVSQLKSILTKKVFVLNEQALQAYNQLLNDRQNDIQKAKAQIIKLSDYYDSTKIHQQSGS